MLMRCYRILAFLTALVTGLAVAAERPGIGVSAEGLLLAGGIVAGQNLGFILNELTRDAALVDDFDQLPIPFRAVGNAWSSLGDARWQNLLYSGSLFAGLESVIGPLQLSVAYNNKDNWSAYLNVGFSFPRLFD